MTNKFTLNNCNEVDAYRILLDDVKFGDKPHFDFLRPKFGLTNERITEIYQYAISVSN